METSVDRRPSPRVERVSALKKKHRTETVRTDFQPLTVRPCVNPMSKFNALYLTCCIHRVAVTRTKMSSTVITKASIRSPVSQCTNEVESALNSRQRHQCLIPNHSSSLVLINHIKNFQLSGNDLFRSQEQNWISLLKNMQVKLLFLQIDPREAGILLCNPR